MKLIRNVKKLVKKVPKKGWIIILAGTVLYLWWKNKQKETPTAPLPDGTRRITFAQRPLHQSREVIFTLTDSGFEPDSPNGMRKDQEERVNAFLNLSYNGIQFRGITAMVVTIRWYEWEPTPGSYQRGIAGLRKLINFCRRNNIKLGVQFWPLRNYGDKYLQPGELMKGDLGAVYRIDIAKEMPSMHAPRPTQLLFNAVQSIAKTLHEYEGALCMTLINGNSAEYQQPITNHTEQAQLTDFSEPALNAFRAWLSSRGFGYQLPSVEHHGTYVMLNTSNEIGREWLRFSIWSQYRYLMNFRNAVKSVSNIPVIHLYDDILSNQSRQVMSGNPGYVGLAADGLYSSAGGRLDDFHRKYIAHHVQRGTFPLKVSAVEVDPVDLGQKPDSQYSGINVGHTDQVLDKIFSIGTNWLFFAMAFSPSEIRSMAGPLYNLKVKYLDKAYSEPQRPTVEYDIANAYFVGGDPYPGIYNSQGQPWIRAVDNQFWGVRRPS